FEDMMKLKRLSGPAPSPDGKWVVFAAEDVDLEANTKISHLLGRTNRFKCIVSHDGMFNAESAYGTSEELWFPEWEFKGPPWKQRDLYRKFSPHTFAANFKTPTLVVHGQNDYRL